MYNKNEEGKYLRRLKLWQFLQWNCIDFVFARIFSFQISQDSLFLASQDINRRQ